MGSWVDDLDQEILDYLDSLVKKGIFPDREAAVKGVLRILVRARKSRTHRKARPILPGKTRPPRDIGDDITIMLRKVL